MSRSFINKLREPDEGFVLHLRMLASIVPIGFGVFFLVMTTITMLVRKQAEAGSLMSQCLVWFSHLSSYLALVLILGSSIGLRILYYYAKAKLSKS